MKHIFLISFIVLILSSILTWWTKPEQQTDKPILFWVTDPNPVRQSQVDTFHKWLAENAPPEDQYELRVDAANATSEKVIIQSVSGVGGDIMDTATDSGQMQYYRQMGIINDLTELSKEFDFSVDKTYEAVAPALQVDGQQYMFPCNIYANLYWTNKGVFKELGLTVPKNDWSFDDFEQLAAQHRKAINDKYGEKVGRQHYLVNKIETLTILRNWGIDLMNETLTNSSLNYTNSKGQSFAMAMAMIRQWTDDDYLPSAADLASIATEAAHSGAGPQMFRKGNYAMYFSGRWALTTFRLYPEFKDFDICIIPPPQDGFQNTTSGSRAAVMYNGYSDERKRLAAYFFKFLASDAYSQTIVESADAIPPSPSYAQREEYKNPKDYPNEKGVHEAYSNALRDIGVLITHSPFIETKIINLEKGGAESGVMADPSLYTPEVAAERAHRRIERRIKQNLKENPDLVEPYEKACADQKRIDELKQAGKKIPRELITNRFYLKYYAQKGMLE